MFNSRLGNILLNIKKLIDFSIEKKNYLIICQKEISPLFNNVHATRASIDGAETELH
jgi:hypothetical protein